MMRGDGEAAERDTPPPDLVLESLLKVPVKEGLGVLLLMDEVMMWIADRAKQPVTGDHFFTQFKNFLQSMTEAVARVPTSALVVSLLASDPQKDDTRGRELLSRISAILKRTEDEQFLPVGRDNLAEVLRRRLLDPGTVKDTEAFCPNVVAAVKALASLDPEYAKTPAPGARVHMLPAGPAAASESGKPSAEADRFIRQTTSPDKPRVNRNALVLAVPSSIGLSAARDRIRDQLAWKEVEKMLVGQAVDPVRAAKLRASLKSSGADMKRAVRRAWCIGVATAEDDSFKAFKVTLDEGKTLSQSIREDADSRIQETPLDPDLLLPGGSYGLWREDEPAQRVKTLVGAFFERSKLPKMLRRKGILDTVANGVAQGRFVLRLRRPDGSARTWWHERPDEAVLAEADLEAVQLAQATLEALPVLLLRPGVLPVLDFAKGVTVVDLLAYFADGHVETVTESVGGAEYVESAPIPACAESGVLEAATAAVKMAHLWVTNGPMSCCGEEPPAGAVAKTATLRTPPAPVPLTALTPEALPDGWSNGLATALSLLSAISAKLAPPGVLLPWSVLCKAINDALNNRFLELVPNGPVPWPYEAQSAAKAEFRLPAAQSIGGRGRADGKPPPGFGEGIPPAVEAPVAAAQLDSAGLPALADALADVQAAVAACGAPLTFNVSVEALGLPPEARQKLRGELAKAAEAFSGSS